MCVEQWFRFSTALRKMGYDSLFACVLFVTPFSLKGALHQNFFPPHPCPKFVALWRVRGDVTHQIHQLVGHLARVGSCQLEVRLVRLMHHVDLEGPVGGIHGNLMK